MAFQESFPSTDSRWWWCAYLLLGTLLLSDNCQCRGREVSYMGCMKRSNSWSFKKRYDNKNETSMSVKQCVEICWYRRLKLAGIQAERECYCGYSKAGLTKVQEKECRSRCTGNCYQACGGPKTLSLYKTGYTREPTFVMEKTAYLPAFIGCYDSRTAVDILCPGRFRPLWTRRLTIPMCIYYCDAVYQTKFSTVAASDKCCCSNSVHGTRNTVLAWCDFHGKPCDGDKKQGCIGTQEKTFQWSTHVRGRLPNFKRWPRTTFTEGKWLKPNFKAGEKYLMSELTQPIEVSAGDATLMGLLAKKKARKKIEEDPKEDDEKQPLVGADKRNPESSETKASAGVVDVPKKTEPASEIATEDDADGEGSSGPIIAVLVIGFMILVAAVGFYLYSQNQKKEEERASKEEAENETDNDADDDDGDDDDDDGDKKVRRRKKKKKKKRKKEKRRSTKVKDGDVEETDDNVDDENAPLIEESADNVENPDAIRTSFNPS